jgi:membrane protease YdiL (CAAX protease family)
MLSDVEDARVEPQQKAAAVVGLCVALFLPLTYVWLTPWLASRLPQSSPSAILIVRDGLSTVLLAAILVLWERSSWNSVGLRKGTWLDWLLVVPLVVVTLCVGVAVQTVFPQGASPSALTGAPLALAIPRNLIVGVFEEFFYRGYAISRLSLLGVPIWLSVLVATVCFTLAHGHTYGFTLGLATPFAIGLIFAIFFAWRRNLGCCIVAHAIVDVIGQA